MKLLVDTNIFLEVLLAQKNADEAKTFLRKTKEYEFYLSDYSFHSIGMLLFRRGLHEIFQLFIRDMLMNAGVTLLSLPVDDMEAVIEAAKRFNLDFDDAYQYAASKKYDLTLVSFDTHFDRTDRGKKTPSDFF